MKTPELTGAALDWAVAKAAGCLHPIGDVRLLDGKLFTIEAGNHEQTDRWQQYSPATDWSQGGPIIEAEGISLTQFQKGEVDECDVGMWGAAHNRDDFGNDAKSSIGSTPLIAAMRAFVTSTLGDEVEVPNEL